MPSFPVREYIPQKSLSGPQHALQKGKLYKVPNRRFTNGYVVNSLEPLLAPNSTMTHELVMGEAKHIGGGLVSLVPGDVFMYLMTLDDGLGSPQVARNMPYPAFDIFLTEDQRIAVPSGIILPLHKVPSR